VDDHRWIENQVVAQAAASSNSELVHALTVVIRSGNWREFTHPVRGLLRYDSLRDYVVDFLELTPEVVEALCEKSNARSSARTVVEELKRLPALNEQPGRPTGSATGNVGNANISNNNDVSYKVRRLKRDRPDLYQQVIDGTLTPNAAAIQAGFRRKVVQVRADDVDRAVTKLLEHYTVDEIRRALPE
jgi:hypothetical protein